MKKILVVHHDQQHQYPLEILLGGSGYQLAFAADETEALTQARQDPPDLIIAETRMPVMAGLALSHEWRFDERLREIPFVFYTATDITERKMAEEKMRVQLRELQRWYDVTLGREERVLELKKEVNELLARLGEPLRYLSVADEEPL